MRNDEMKLSVDLRIDSEEFCKALDGYIERVKQLEDALNASWYKISARYESRKMA